MSLLPLLETMVRDVRSTLGKYLKGQLLVSTGVGLLTWAGLGVCSVPGAGWLALLAAVLSPIPWFGPLVACVVGLIVAVFSGNPWASLAAVSGVFLAVQLLESLVLSPLFLGRSLGVHPMGVLVALVVSGAVLGPLGVVLAVPLAALAWKWGRGLFQLPPGRSGSSSRSEEKPR